MKSILFGDDLIRQQKKFRGFNAFITIYINKKKKTRRICVEKTELRNVKGEFRKISVSFDVL